MHSVPRNRLCRLPPSILLGIPLAPSLPQRQSHLPHVHQQQHVGRQADGQQPAVRAQLHLPRAARTASASASSWSIGGEGGSLHERDPLGFKACGRRAGSGSIHLVVNQVLDAAAVAVLQTMKWKVVELQNWSIHTTHCHSGVRVIDKK